MFELGKFSLIILTRCNLHCRLCCEYVPQNTPFPDMTVNDEEKILSAAFDTIDYIKTLHLTGGGEPFLHPQLGELIEGAMKYSEKFDRLMLFTNCTVPVSPKLMSALVKYKEKILVQVSRYGLFPEREEKTLQSLLDNHICCKVVKYYGEEQDFGGWVDFGPWISQNKDAKTLEKRFRSCALTDVMHGNWRTRDGKVHWCTRSQRGMELGLIPDHPEDYVDLFDSTSREEKQEKFRQISKKQYISACDHCSGDPGTEEAALRHPAAEQID